MNETVEVNKDKEEEVLAELDSFAELPDAPPKRKFRLSWKSSARLMETGCSYVL